MEHERGKEKGRCRAIAGADGTEIGSNVLSPLKISCAAPLSAIIPLPRAVILV